MAILVLGKSVCPICGLVIHAGQDAISFPAFVGNELDPLYPFSDATCHESCFRQHPLAEMTTSVIHDLRIKSAADNRHCAACGQLVLDPDDYISLGLLTSDASHDLFQHNFRLFHRSCLPKWPQREAVKQSLLALQAAGKWRGRSFGWLLERL